MNYIWNNMQDKCEILGRRALICKKKYGKKPTYPSLTF